MIWLSFPQTRIAMHHTMERAFPDVGTVQTTLRTTMGELGAKGISAIYESDDTWPADEADDCAREIDDDCDDKENFDY